MSHTASMGRPQSPLTPGPHRKRIGLISIVACFGGLLFGYDTGVSNGAEGPMADKLGLSLLQLGILISSLIFAAAVGALVGGKISDAIGRRTTNIVPAVMFFVAVLVVVFSPGFAMLVVGRIILGLAVGGASTVVPVPWPSLRRSRSAGRPRAERAGDRRGPPRPSWSTTSSFATLGHVEGVWHFMFGVCALPRSRCSSACCGCPSRRAGSSKRAATRTPSRC